LSGASRLDKGNAARQVAGMKKPEWPGIATSVGIILITTTVLLSYNHWDVTEIQKWQTLIAAGIALLAAGVAWATATVRLSFEKRNIAIDRRRKTLAIFFQTDLAMRDVSDRCVSICGNLARRTPYTGIGRDQVSIDEPEEFSAIWDNLDIFPRRIIDGLSIIRRTIRAHNRLLPTDGAFPGSYSSDTAGGVGQDNLETLADRCDLIIVALKPLIADLMEEN
jgi:hypothetical protein